MLRHMSAITAAIFTSMAYAGEVGVGGIDAEWLASASEKELTVYVSNALDEMKSDLKAIQRIEKEAPKCVVSRSQIDALIEVARRASTDLARFQGEGNRQRVEPELHKVVLARTRVRWLTEEAKACASSRAQGASAGSRMVVYSGFTMPTTDEQGEGLQFDAGDDPVEASPFM